MVYGESELEALRRSADDVEKAYQRRYELIRKAYEAGCTSREIAKALGLSRTALDSFMGRRASG